MKKLALALLVIAALSSTAMAADKQSDNQKTNTAAEQSEKIDMSIWFDLGAAGNKAGPIINDYSLRGAYDVNNQFTFGVGVTLFKYFGMRAWFGEATSNYSDNAKSSPFASQGGDGGEGRLPIPRQGFTLLPNYQYTSDIYLTADQLRASGRYINIGRKTYGPKLGFDFFGVWPATKHVSIYAGPGFYIEKSAEFFGVIDPANNKANVGQARDDRQDICVAGSAGIQLRTFGQLADWGLFPHTKITDKFMVTGGYHTERGLTFGAGLAF